MKRQIGIFNIPQSSHACANQVYSSLFNLGLNLGVSCLVSVAVVEEGARENDHDNGNQECSFKVGEPNDPALNELAGKIAAKWQTLGLYLGIGQDTLDEIDANERDKPYRMLLRWKSTTPSTTLYQDLYNALCHVRVGRNNVAREFCCKKTT